MATYNANAGAGSGYLRYDSLPMTKATTAMETEEKGLGLLLMASRRKLGLEKQSTMPVEGMGTVEVDNEATPEELMVAME